MKAPEPLMATTLQTAEPWRSLPLRNACSYLGPRPQGAKGGWKLHTIPLSLDLLADVGSPSVVASPILGLVGKQWL